MNPAVSVIIPFRGRIPWLREAVDSVLTQTFGDFELILVDDGSDQPPSFLDEIRDDRVRCILQRPSGAGTARNAGIRKATGKYIAFLDSDDVFLPGKLEFQFRSMEEHPGLVFSHTSYLRMDADGHNLETIDSGSFTGMAYPRIITCCPIATPTVMVLKDVLGDLKFEESVRVGEDVILWIRIARRHEILGIREPLTRVRMHGRNAALLIESQIEGSRNIFRAAFLEDRSFPPAQRREAYAKLHSNFAGRYHGEGKHMKALSLLVAGLRYAPTDRELLGNIFCTLRSLAREAIPVRFHPAIKCLKDALRNLTGTGNR